MIMNKKTVFATIALVGAIVVGGFALSGKTGDLYHKITTDETQPLIRTAYSGPVNNQPVSFEQAADAAVPSVVHIRTVVKSRQVAQQQNPFEGMDDDIFRHFFGDGGGRRFQQPEQRASGSGVIISGDGYIVTNNHVVNGASDITVTLSNRKNYKAEVVGTDPNTDLALIKVDGKNLPVMPVGNSDDVKLGQWVMAIGYPLNLDVTVTQGIISAKSRNIGINRQAAAPVESFLQTDAAVNPGSSGGALVNTNGELIGINAAIASPTGSYAGYAYAIPSNLMKKVINDIKQFGSVQRGYLGISMAPENLDDAQKKELGIKDDEKGVFVAGIDPSGAAAAAGIKQGDVITHINGAPVGSGAQLSEQIARQKPGDKVKLSYLRNGSGQDAEVTLKGKMGAIAGAASATVQSLGADFATLPAGDAREMGIAGGVQVTDIGEGVLADQTNMKKGFVITRVGGMAVRSVDELKAALQRLSGNFQIEGMYPGSDKVYYYGINDY
ncbi:PDZ domain-containing protein [Chitinophaga lutea]|uniref:PDZ domain-containing protein n=2 Tax=Chitinophaga lutea TaxID=2488634 RepID=A0A3N4Q9B0_9BACT|nr:PDZ domain-containing protein [Chitinophaga lutea]